MHRKDRAGFTLIELLVVIAIIGLLASIVLASLNTSRKKSRDARRIADLKQLANALELYSNEHSGSYPSDATTALVTGEPISVGLAALLTAGNIPALPNDPLLAPNVYMYKTIPDTNVADDATGYCIGTHIEGALPTPNTTCQSLATLIGQSQGVDVINYEIGN